MKAAGLSVWFTAFCGLVTGCSLHTPLSESDSQSASHSPTVLLFFVDGLDAETLERLALEGQLPNIQREFIEGGVTVENAIASLPPITYPNAVSLITGRFPGHHGVLGNQWFDRKERLIRDYGSPSTYQIVNQDFECPTIFEILEDRFTVNVQGHTRRGVSVSFDNKVASGVEWFLGDFSDVDALVGDSVDRVIDVAIKRGQQPAVYMSYFPGVDEVGHRFGCDSEEYTEALVVVDQAIGNIIDKSRAAWGDAIFCVLVSDHGHVPTPSSRRVNIARQLSSVGLAVHQGPVQSPLRWLRSLALDDYNAVLVVGAYRRAAIHLRGPGGWDEPASLDKVQHIVGDLIAQEGANGSLFWEAVEAVCFRSTGGGVEVIDQVGQWRIERRRRDDKYEYRIVTKDGTSIESVHTTDVNELAQGPAAMSWRDSREWLHATAASNHPDFVVQVAEMFDSPRAGDVVLFAASDWTFDQTSAGGHGSSLRRDMRIPMYWSGPGLPAGGRVNAARLVDVAPTIIYLLDEDGESKITKMDGTSLLGLLRDASVR